jgi:glutamate formiminotransferase
MVPAAALLDSSCYYMQSARFDAKQVIELAILDQLREEEEKG